MTGPCPYQARAYLGDDLIAETRGAIRVDAPNAAPLLWFPIADVGAQPDDCVTEGDGNLAGYVAFDWERVRIEIVDAVDGDAERDITIKQFPTWGDANDLVAVLDARVDVAGHWTAKALADWRRPVVEGSQILGQAIVAAGRRTNGRRAVAANLVFTRVGEASKPVAIEFDDVLDGRTFSALATRAVQGGRVLAAGTLLMDSTAPDVMRHGVAAPDVPGPYESTPFDMGVTGRDLRVVDAAYTGDSDAPIGPPTLDCWVRFRSVADEPGLHAGLLAQFTGHMSIAAAMRPHAGIGQNQAHRTLSTAVNAISLSMHRDVRVDEWVLYHHESTFAGDGMTHAECRAFNETGDLLASFSVDAMVRGFADPNASVDDRTAL